jgi:hypothetical protein
MTWGFIWLMFILKIPIFGLFGIVYWAWRQTDEPAPPETARVKPDPRPHPPTKPKRKRPRGPHGDPAALPAPPRVRPVTAIAPALAAREHERG